MARPSNAQKERDFIDSVMKKLKLASDADDHNRIAAIEDLNFVNNDQWTSVERKRRSDKGRPCLTLNMLTKYIRQVVGDLLHNTPSINFIPIDSQGDVNLAAIRQGIVNSIQYNSDAESIYDYAANMFVSCGYGSWRVLTRYTDDNPFLQEIVLELVRNPFLVYLDPSAKSKSGDDAKWGFVLEKMRKDDFEAKYPGAKYGVPEAMKVGKGLAQEKWFDKDTITVAEFFEIKSKKEKMYLLEDGRVCNDEELKDVKERWEKQRDELMSKMAPPPVGGPPPLPGGQGVQPQQPPAVSPAAPASPAPSVSPPTGDIAPPGAMPAPSMMNPAVVEGLKHLGPEPKVAQEREVDTPVVKHWILTMNEILEGGLEGDTVAGKYIPLVVVKGPEINIEGKNHTYSLIRHAKDPQKLINYWNSAAAEVIALAPKAPFMATPKQIEGHEHSYATAGVDNQPFLLYNYDPDVPGPPSRMQPGNPPEALFKQIAVGEENLKSVIGLFNADVGAQGSEQTGAAIMARQRPGDISTYIFAKNLAGAVTYTGKIINEMIPEVYDTERDVQIRRPDEQESFVPVNTTVGTAIRRIGQNPSRYAGLSVDRLRELASADGVDAKYNDLTTGKYGVRVTTGPSYATQRQESAHLLLQLVQAMPEQMRIATDLIVENMDFKDSDELAGRLRKPLVMQGITKPRPGDQPMPPPPPPPQVQLAQAKLENEKMKLQQKTLEIQQTQVQLEIEKIKLQVELAKAQGDGVDQHALMEKMDKSQREWERLQLERDKFEHQMTADVGRLENERYKIDAQASKRESANGG